MTNHTDPAAGDELDLDVFAPAAETTTELGCCSRSPLTPEQEIRSDALDYAVQLATAEISFPVTNFGVVLDLAEVYADWIRTGQRPGTPAACTCTPIPGQPGIRGVHPQCPQHGQPE